MLRGADTPDSGLREEASEPNYNRVLCFHIQGWPMAERHHAIAPETSSAPLQIPEEQELLFREILESIERSEVPYAVAGAFALREHTGICRDTKDLDLFLTRPMPWQSWNFFARKVLNVKYVIRYGSSKLIVMDFLLT